jgi:cell division protein FtsB
MTQHRKKLSHARELYYILFILFVVLLGAFSIWGPDGYMALKSAQRELQHRRARVEDLERGNAQKVRTIQGLRSDKAVMETIAREKGYVRKGEIVQHLPERPRQPK